MSDTANLPTSLSAMQPETASTASQYQSGSIEQQFSTSEAVADGQSTTVTITESAVLPPLSVDQEMLTLSLRARPLVRWDEAVVDNEGMGRKSSKRCCIFHKQKAFGESSTDSSDYDSDRSGSSAASAGANDDNGEPKKAKKRNRKIARPKKKIPDSQRFHA